MLQIMHALIVFTLCDSLLWDLWFCESEFQWWPAELNPIKLNKNEEMIGPLKGFILHKRKPVC